MSFDWPFALLFLLFVPLVLAIYVRLMRKRRKGAITYSSVALLKSARPRRSRWHRHIPLAMLLGTLTVLGLAAARPEITSNVPVGQTSIILALDDSGSMCSTDVKPNRLGAAQKAAREYVDSQPNGVRVGLVVFSAFAELTVAPTTDRASLDRAIENLSTAPGTAIGAAMLQALEAISEINPDVRPIGNALAIGAEIDPNAGFGGPGGGGGTAAPTTTTLPTQKPGKDGYVPDVVVLLTDGANNRGIEPLDAVPYAISRGVRIYTIGFGTTHPAPLLCTAQQEGGVAGGGFAGGGFGGGGFGGGGFGGGRSPLVADVATLQQVSKQTGGKSYTAKDASQLSTVFKNLPKEIAVQKKRHEISDDFVALAGLLALLAIGASIKWSPYP